MCKQIDVSRGFVHPRESGRKWSVVDLFAGAGGSSLGFQNAGFEIIGAFEFWKLAADTYAANFDHPVHRIDLSDVETTVSIISRLHPDVIIGSPPCQEFSDAGERIEGERAALTVAFAEIVDAIMPNFFVMENVRRAQHSNAYAVARAKFKTAGYGLTEIMLNAALCGVPQRRKRFFCIGSLGAKDGFLSEYLINAMSKTEMTVRDYMGNALQTDFYYMKSRNATNRAVYSVDEPAPTIRGTTGPIPPSYTMRHGDKEDVATGLVRSLTTEERSYLQTFPADFKWSGIKTHDEKMIGNSVAPKQAEFVAKALIHYNDRI